MPTPITHAVSALAVGSLFVGRGMPRKALAVGAALAVAPDLDIAAFSLGIPYGAPLGHRGLSHSLVFAAGLGGVAAAAFSRIVRVPDPARSPGRGTLWLYFFLCAASHGVLDALTDGGRGVAFLAPFDDTRYFLPFRPIRAAPLSLRGILSERTLATLSSEFLWVWIPSSVLAGLGIALNGLHRSRRSSRKSRRPR
jgi:inner membrane protein